MNILGIDCSTKITNIGVFAGGSSKTEINLELARRQSAELPLLVRRALDESGLAFSDLDLIAVGKGPGYYTGIRTGVAYAAALAEGLGLNVVPLSTLEIFCFDLAAEHRLLAPALKANRDHLYGAIYESGGGELSPVLHEGFFSAGEFAEILLQYGNVLLVGSDYDLYEAAAGLPQARLPRLSGFGRSVAEMGARHEKFAVPPSVLRGEYLRDPDIGPARK